MGHTRLVVAVTSKQRCGLHEVADTDAAGGICMKPDQSWKLSNKDAEIIGIGFHSFSYEFVWLFPGSLFQTWQ